MQKSWGKDQEEQVPWYVDVDLFHEIKKMRNAPEHVANIVDGESKDIPGYFVKIYSELYNSTDDAK